MLNKSRVYSLNDRLNLQKNSIISEDMMLGDKVKIKGYGISEGEGISLEKIFHPVLLYIVDGRIDFTIEDKKSEMIKGNSVLIPSGEWRGIDAIEDSKILIINMEEDIMIKNMDKSKILELVDEVEYSEDKIVSKTLVQNDALSMTLMAFDGKQELSTHAAGGDALVIALDGEVLINIDGEEFDIKKDESIIMPANIPHSLHINDKFKMLLIVSKKA
ncbi:MAG: cupin domain-containing protein [Andreesenia angusta]|nr:cupin domain-containing protein [Andreesenia angusta]